MGVPKGNGEWLVKKRQFDSDREYTAAEVIRENLKVWWLLLLSALAGALFLGGYKYWSNRDFVSEKNYEELYQVTASFCVRDYSHESAPERVGTVIKIADSRSAYEEFQKISGYQLEYLGYQALFDLKEGQNSDIVTLYVKYPRAYEEFAIADEKEALLFAEYLLEAIAAVTERTLGNEAIRVLDAPYAAAPEQIRLAYAPDRTEFRQEVAKAAAAGVLFGIIVEVALYTAFLTGWKKEKL